MNSRMLNEAREAPMEVGAQVRARDDAAPPLQLQVLPGGWRVAAWPDRTLLQSLHAAGAGMPTSCRNGTCRTCLCRMVSGEVGYRIEWPGLLPEEKAEGWILPCVAYPACDVVIDAPAASPPG